MVPKNKMYITREDYKQWQDYMSPLIESQELINEEYSHGNKQLYSISKDSDLKVKNITFVVTERCNLNCTYCYETHKSNKRMTKEIGKQAVDFILNEELINEYYDVKTSPAVILEFIGGEPLLEIELIDYIVEYFKFRAFELNNPWATNYMISITTNGVLFNTEKVQDFVKKNKDRLSIGITIDGNKKLHDSCRIFHDGSGSYDIVEKSIKTWLKTNNDPQTKITLSPFNVMYLNDALKNVWGLGIHGAFTNCVFEEGWTIEHAKVLYSEMIKLADYLLEDENYSKYYCSLFDEIIGTTLTETRNWCGGNGSMLAIGTDGKCFPCIRFMKYSLSTPGREEKCIGNIFDGLERKENNIWLLELKKVDMITQSDDKCRKCKIASGCSLCTGYNYDKFGTPNKRATFICDMHHARVLANYYYFNKLYNKLNLDKKFELNVPKEWALQIMSAEDYSKLIGGGL